MGMGIPVDILYRAWLFSILPIPPVTITSLTNVYILQGNEKEMKGLSFAFYIYII